MIKKLRYWKRQWQTVSFNISKGVARFNLFPLNTPEPFGFAYKYMGNWYSVYVNEGKIIFQCGDLRIELNGSYKFKNDLSQSKNSRKFLVLSNSKCLLEVEYKSFSDRWYSKSDLTYDEFDEEMDDFFLWLVSLANDKNWQNDVTNFAAK